MPILVTCEECGVEIKRSPSVVKEHNFCSTACFHKWLGIRRREPLLVACNWCAKEIVISPSELHTRHGNFCSRQCYGEWRSENMRGKSRPSPSHITRQRIASSLKGHASYERTTITREKIKQKAKELNYVKHFLAGRTVRPNKQEQKMLRILNQNFTNQWKYTGDGSLIIGGYIPDFTNCDGRKDLIELFGDYWHSSEKVDSWKGSELGKIMAYNSLGYRCLVIWEHELKDEQAVVAKVKQFMKRRLKWKTFIMVT